MAAVGVAMLALTRAELTFARWCFWLATVLITVSHVMWQWTADQPYGLKIATGVIVGAFLFGGLAAGIGWIQQKEAATQQPTTTVTQPPTAAPPNISFQKFALFWVELDKESFQLGAVTKFFNLDSVPYLVKGVVFDGDSWALIPRGSYLIRKFWGFEDRFELMEDNYIKAGNEAFFKKILPIRFEMTVNGGSMPDFIMRGKWNLSIGSRMIGLRSTTHYFRLETMGYPDLSDSFLALKLRCQGQ